MYQDVFIVLVNTFSWITSISTIFFYKFSKWKYSIFINNLFKLTAHKQYSGHIEKQQLKES